MSYIGNSPALKYASFAVQHFTTSATTSYSLSNSVANENELALFINNVRQQPGGSYAYTAAGTTLTLSAATTSSDTMYCVFIGKAVQTVVPPDGSVETSQLAALAVTNAKVADDAIGVDELSATGTASSSTFLRGDNSWTAPTVTDIAWQSVVTASTLTAVAGYGYPINTTSNACTVTLPAGSVGDTILFVDYAGTWDTNNVTIAANGSEKINGGDIDAVASVEREGLKLVYVDGTQGWLLVSAANEGSSAFSFPYTLSWLVIAGGGGGGDNHAAGGGAGGYRNSYASEASGGGGSSETAYAVSTGVAITVTVGGGGAGATSSTTRGDAGEDSSISGSGLTTITSAGGGSGGCTDGDRTGEDGGSGGGGTRANAPGSGTANQGYDGSPSFNSGNYPAGGGGGAGAAAVCADNTAEPDGGVGVSSSINGSATFRGGGGGGGAAAGGASAAGEGGNGGGGDGKSTVTAGDDGTANTGGGGGGGGPTGSNGGAGGSGVVILRMATANYSSTTTGSPGVTTDGSDTILTFTGDGSYTT